MWENSSPRDHCKDPTSADVAVAAPGTQPRIEGFYPKRSYGFSSPTLLDIIGDRMLMFARARVKYPQLSDNVIRALDYGDWIWKETGAHYEKMRADLTEIGIHNDADVKRVKAELDLVDYTMEDLRFDLRLISKVFRSARG